MDDREMTDSLNELMETIAEKVTEQVTKDVRDDDQYSFSHPRVGFAVIIMNRRHPDGHYRQGSEVDEKNLKDIFNHYGFEVITIADSRRSQLLNKLQEVSLRNHSECSCFALAVSSHGESLVSNGVKQDVILTSDYPVTVMDIMKYFTDEKCPGLAKKPRLVFVQACRGQQVDDGEEIYCIKTPKHEYSSMEDKIDAIYVPHIQQKINIIPKNHTASLLFYSTPALTKYHSSLRLTAQGKQILQEQDSLTEPVTYPAPCYKDFLVMYATPPGYYAFRRPSGGSWFINSLTEVLLHADGRRDLLRELTRVIGKVARDFESVVNNPAHNRKKQTPVIYSMLSKDVYLKPKSMKHMS